MSPRLLKMCAWMLLMMSWCTVLGALVLGLMTEAMSLLDYAVPAVLALGTALAANQFFKMAEEAQETLDAVTEYIAAHTPIEDTGPVDADETAARINEIIHRHIGAHHDKK